MSLKTFHLFFILVAIMGADLFGGWAVHEYRSGGDLTILLLGIACMLGGFGLVIYVFRLVRTMEKVQAPR